MHTLISTDELDERRHEPDTIIFDASYYLPNEPNNAAALFLDSHIPGAAFLDLDVVSDPSNPLPHMVPPADLFARTVAEFGVGTDSMIVAYDQRGIFSAARVWWLFKLFGHDDVLVLDGGLPKWRAESRKLESGPAELKPTGSFPTNFQAAMVRNRADIEQNLNTKGEIVVDARSNARFTGEAAEPRQGMRSGHVPGAISLPFSDLLRSNQTMHDPATLLTLFEARGVGASAKPVTMCGSGVTGAVLTLGLARAGLPIGALYDGSWAEWGGATDTPIERTA
ncbi:MAG: 3-mercaptopyruvate sulfurtransferase [Acidiphilium sp. 37-64-53]|uniref:sulfurtransferase n=1 Tax=Acidiphilium TaxID=522 RepID=UPI000BCEE91B|nr:MULTISPECIES: sulfurtransferase [Acidiphilium]OYW04001.1 MAG: 3-mercaptopyruvate sulfurtransferase [Acidiphilium sp. 37-64-53]HQT83229.1 sulfurtransferase [Acidiphilium rubrum]